MGSNQRPKINPNPNGKFLFSKQKKKAKLHNGKIKASSTNGAVKHGFKHGEK